MIFLRNMLHKDDFFLSTINVIKAMEPQLPEGIKAVDE